LYYSKLQQDGWCYINEQQCGTRGLILVKSLNGQIYVFDRNSPQLCPSQDTTLEVIENTYIYCPKDEAKWMMNGSPVNDQTKGISPKRYFVNYNDSTGQISISN